MPAHEMAVQGAALVAHSIVRLFEQTSLHVGSVHSPPGAENRLGSKSRKMNSAVIW